MSETAIGVSEQSKCSEVEHEARRLTQWPVETRVTVTRNTTIQVKPKWLPGHPPELWDSVRLLLADAKRHEFEIDQV